MNLIYSLLFVFLVSCTTTAPKECFQFGDSRKIDNSFSVVTYNVHGLPWCSLNFSEMSLPLNGYDIVLIQELFANYEKMGCFLGHEHSSKEKEGFWYGDGLARYSRVPFVSYERESWIDCNGRLSDSNDCLTKKGFSFAWHEISEGVRIAIYNVHMDAGKSLKDATARTMQADQLLNHIEKHNSYRAVLLVGDFNLDFDNVVDYFIYEKFINKGFKDACTKETMCMDVNAIDKVLYKPNTDPFYRGTPVEIKPIWYEKRVDFRDKNGVPLSDHYPIGVTFKWKVR